MQIDFSPNYSIEYSNPLRTHSTHLKSGNTIITDAPTDNHGKGEAFSPTDLLASSLVSCVMTIIGIAAERDGVEIVLMNAKVETNNGKMPVKIYGQKLKNTKIIIDVPSAQIKSGLILAALNTDGKTKIIEKHTTRNHTEIMLESFEANIDLKKNNNKTEITIIGKKELTPKNIDVPADLSSSAFFIVAALINKNSEITLKNININPTRNGILIALKKMGANIEIINNRFINNENVADLKVKSSQLNGCELDEDMAKLMIDEYPIISIAAAFANTPSVFKGLKELRVKESDRLNLIKINLEKCGCNCKIENDNLFINPIEKLNINNQNIQTDFDHRIAMSFLVMGSRLGELYIEKSDSIKTSFPNFVEEFNRAGGNIY